MIYLRYEYIQGSTVCHVGTISPTAALGAPTSSQLHLLFSSFGSISNCRLTNTNFRLIEFIHSLNSLKPTHSAGPSSCYQYESTSQLSYNPHYGRPRLVSGDYAPHLVTDASWDSHIPLFMPCVPNLEYTRHTFRPVTLLNSYKLTTSHIVNRFEEHSFIALENAT